MPFKKMKSVPLSYNKQGYIYFTCHHYAECDQATRAKIDTLCERVGREYRSALFRVLTTDEPLNRIAHEHYVSPAVLYRKKARFFSEWYRFDG